jgi:hypothetical protein
MPKWRVNVTGDPWHLKTLAGLNVGVTEEGGGFVLRGPEFDALTDAGAVRERAVELVDALNALGWYADHDFEPVSIGAVIGDDGTNTISVFVADTLRLGERLQAQVIDRATGQPIPPPPPPAFYAKAFDLALRDDAVRRALHFLAPPVVPGDLYKVYEVIRDDMGGKWTGKAAILNKGWATPDELKRFRGVHYPSVFGDEARHGVDEVSPPPPSNPMSFPEAQAFLSRLLAHWIDSK